MVGRGTVDPHILRVMLHAATIPFCRRARPILERSALGSSSRLVRCRSPRLIPLPDSPPVGQDKEDARSCHPRRHSDRRDRGDAADRRHSGAGGASSGRRQGHRTGRPRRRRRRGDGDPRLRGHPHPLRRPGDLGLPHPAVVKPRRDHGRDGELRRWLRPRSPHRPRPVDRVDGRCRGHPGCCATPTVAAAREELVGIARALGEVGSSVLQVVSDFPEFDTEMETLLEMMRVSHRPLSVSLSQGRTGVGHRHILAAIAAANNEGLQMRAQVPARGIGVLIGLQCSVNPLRGSETYRALEGLALPELVATLSDAALRTRILRELPQGVGILDRVFELVDPPDYEPAPGDSIAARAARGGTPAEELFFELLLGDGGKAMLYWPILNYFDGNLDAAAELLADPNAVPGLSDGGAHAGTICDASFPTTLLSYWCRARPKGVRFVPEWIVSRQCRATAEAVGLLDRGIIAPGFKADLNVIDFERLGMAKPRLVFDLPAGGKRLLQSSFGYLHTFVSGVEVATDGESTGETPGSLVRGAQAMPAR